MRFQKLYMEALRREWEQKKSLLENYQLVSIYFGGGTPSLLGSDNISTILSWLPSASEVTLEANPESMIAPSGINRLSVGIQSFDDILLQKLGRTHTAKEAEEAIRTSPIENISIDLMYDLPNQSVAQWESTLERALALPINHISLYNLTIEPHTSFYKRRHTLQLPSQDDSLQMLQTAINMCSSFERYELSAFAKPSYKSKHNMGYWTGRPFLGLGPSAFSYWDNARFRTTAHFNKWVRNPHTHDFHERLPQKERDAEMLAVGLRLIKGVETELNVETLIAEGWLERKERRVCLTKKGQLFHDTVAERVMQLS